MQNTDLNSEAMAERINKALERNKRRAEEGKKGEQGNAARGTLRTKDKALARAKGIKRNADTPRPCQRC